MKKLRTVLLYILALCTLCFVAASLSACFEDPNAYSEDGIQYRKMKKTIDGTQIDCYLVTGCDADTTRLNIPAEINGLPVADISSTAFQNNSTLKEVTLPDTITGTSSNSAPFKGCSNIEKLTAPTCHIRGFFKENANTIINDLNPLPKSLKILYLTHACSTVYLRSLRFCRYLRELHIPSSVTTIYDGTDSLPAIGVNGHIPNNDKYDDLPFLGCINLTIFCEAESAPENWQTYWNYIDAATSAKVEWNNYGGSTESESQNNGDREEYTLLADLNASKLSANSGWTTVQNTANGKFTITNSDYPSMHFSWNLSEYPISIYNEYLLIFENLALSDNDTPRTPTLMLNWQDSSFNFLKYYNTNEKYFNNNVNNDYYRIDLASLDYDSLSIEFAFYHYNVAGAKNKRMYFEIDGINKNGKLTFDKLSIYYKTK